MDTISSYIWSEQFWFPHGIGWKDFENHPDTDVYLPQYSDMLWSFPLGMLLLAFRFVFERAVVAHVARWLGVKEKKRELKPQPVLETWYQQNGVITDSNIESVSKQTDLSIREIERWLRDRKALSKSCVLKKFQLCSWHFVFYISSFTGGLIVLLNKPWFWKTELCWKNWPKIHIANDVYWYYLIELSYYWCLVFSMVTDHKRKAVRAMNTGTNHQEGSHVVIDRVTQCQSTFEDDDHFQDDCYTVNQYEVQDFGQMIVHHIATILLIYFSWVANFAPIGTLTMLTHDVADFPLAKSIIIALGHYKQANAYHTSYGKAGKLFKYSGYTKLCKACFGVFVVVWILSRLMYYPYVVLYSSSVEVYIHLEPCWSHYFFHGLMIVLQVLHLVWSYYISKILYGTLFKGRVQDSRSESESD